MSEPFVGSEMSEELEGIEELSRETLELNEMTNEPGSYIEGKIDVAQSEAIESTFNELVNTAQEPAENPGECNPIPIPLPIERLELAETGADEAELSTAEPAENLAKTMPLPIPQEWSEASIDPEPIVREVDEAELSTVEPAENLAEVLPIPVPGGSAETVGAGEDASIDPRPIIMEAEPAENLAENLPIPVPKEGQESAGAGAATVEFNVAGEVSATFNGSTVSLIPENDAQSPQGVNPQPNLSDSATEDSSPDLIGENG